MKGEATDYPDDESWRLSVSFGGEDDGRGGFDTLLCTNNTFFARKESNKDHICNPWFDLLRVSYHLTHVSYLLCLVTLSRYTRQCSAIAMRRNPQSGISNIQFHGWKHANPTYCAPHAFLAFYPVEQMHISRQVLFLILLPPPHPTPTNASSSLMTPLFTSPPLVFLLFVSTRPICSLSASASGSS